MHIVSPNNFINQNISKTTIVKSEVFTIKNNFNIIDTKVKTLPQIMDTAIKNYLDSGTFNIVEIIKFNRILNKALPLIMQPKNFLNQGHDSKVFRISDKYVAKINRNNNEKKTLNLLSLTKSPNKRFNNIGIYYGEPLIRVGHVEILKNATPHEYTPCGITWHNPGDMCTNEQRERYYKEYLPLCSSLPQESYDEFAFELQKLNNITKKTRFGKISYFPDIINPNNILITDNSFRIVDELEKTRIDKPNNLYTMLQPLLLRQSPDSPVYYEKSAIKYRRIILYKCAVAAQKAKLSFEPNSKIQSYPEYTLSQIVGKKYLEKIKKMGTY